MRYNYKHMENKKPLVFAVVGVAVVVIVALVAVSLKRSGMGGPVAGGGAVKPGAGGVVVKGEDAFRPENEKALGTVEGGTR